MDTILNSAKKVLGRAKVSVLDSARFVRNILDAKPSDSKLTDAQFVLKVIDAGLRNIRAKEMSLADGFALYLKSKQHLRPDSVRDIRCIGNRLLRTSPEFGKRNFSELSVAECEEWLNAAFHTNPQFNKARTMLHGLFEFALRREWCDKNPIKRIERQKVVEKEIQPLKLAETKRLIKTAQNESPEYAVVAALLVYTGIRPREVRRLTWRDIDTEEKTITVRSQCSKTGGVRQVEIPPVLNRLLITHSRELKEEKSARQTGNTAGAKSAIILAFAGDGFRTFCATHTQAFTQKTTPICRAFNLIWDTATCRFCAPATSICTAFPVSRQKAFSTNNLTSPLLV